MVTSGSSLRHVHIAEFALIIALLTSIFYIKISVAADSIATEVPIASSMIFEVEDQGDGLYAMWGFALDSDGYLACALVLASGKCMFSCGPRSLLCEGGTSPWDYRSGEFLLRDLPTETDGSIRLHVFIDEHMPFTYSFNPDNLTRWIVQNAVCCPSGPSTFLVTIDGMTLGGRLESCESPSLFSGGISVISPGTKLVSYSLSAPACGIHKTGSFTSTDWLVDGCYAVGAFLEGDIVIREWELISCGFAPSQM